MWDSLRFDLTAAVCGLTSARAFTALTVLALPARRIKPCC